jgi:hypothetical protein
MKLLLSFLFYGVMIGTTASVGTGMEGDKKDSKPTPVVITTINAIATAKPVLITKTSGKTFKAFAVRQKRNEVVITWAASSEDITKFVVQQSTDGKLFQPLTAINNSNAIAYKYALENQQYNYYRVAAFKTQGSIEYSAARKSRMPRR